MRRTRCGGEGAVAAGRNALGGTGGSCVRTATSETAGASASVVELPGTASIDGVAQQPLAEARTLSGGAQQSCSACPAV